MVTTTEKYIKKAVEEAKNKLSGNHLSNCNINMHMEADGATEMLAEAMLAQAKANLENSLAMKKLAESLKPIDACAIRITNEGINV